MKIQLNNINWKLSDNRIGCAGYIILCKIRFHKEIPSGELKLINNLVHIHMTSKSSTSSRAIARHNI